MTRKFDTFWTTIWLSIFAVLVFAWSPDSYATNTPPKPPQHPPVDVDVSAKALAVAGAKVDVDVDAGSESISNAVNEGVDQDVSIAYPRQAPSLGQGSMYLVGCGLSINGGGSQTGGAAILGVNIITPYCRDQAQIAREAALGNVKTACEMDRLTRAGKRNLKRLREAGMEAEPCPVSLASPAPAPAPEAKPVVIVLQGESCASRTDEKIERVFQKCMAK